MLLVEIMNTSIHKFNKSTKNYDLVERPMLYLDIPIVAVYFIWSGVNSSEKCKTSFSQNERKFE